MLSKYLFVSVCGFFSLLFYHNCATCLIIRANHTRNPKRLSLACSRAYTSACSRINAFPRLPLVSCFPRFSPGYTFTRAFLQGRVIRKPINVNSGLKVNRSINFSCIKMFLTAYIWCSLKLLKLKTEGQTI